MKLSALKFKKEVFGLIKTRVGTTGVDESKGQCPKTLYLYYTMTKLCYLASKSSFPRLLGPQVDLACTSSKPSDFTWTPSLLKEVAWSSRHRRTATAIRKLLRKCPLKFKLEVPASNTVLGLKLVLRLIVYVTSVTLNCKIEFFLIE